MGERLIFLVSQPRAGSTLLQYILAGLDDVATTNEPWLMLHPLYAPRETGHTADYDAVVAARALGEFLVTLPEGQAAHDAAVRAYANELYAAACRRAGKGHFLDKTPRYYKILPDLARVFPEARFVILLRNPAAVFSSIMQTWMRGEWTRFDYFRDDLLQAPRLLAQFLTAQHPHTAVVNYESLILSPEETVRRLCDELGFPYAPRLLEYGEREALPGRYGDPVGVRQHSRPSADSLSRWLTHAKEPQTNHLLAAYLNHLGPTLLNELGYNLAELQSALAAVVQDAGKPAVTWSRLIARDKTLADKAWLIAQEARRERSPARAVRQLARLLTKRL